MRKLIRGFSAGVLVLACGTLASGGGMDEAKGMIARAVKAAGGQAKLAGLKTGAAKAKADVQGGNQQVGATIEAHWHGLERYRFTVAADFGGNVKNLVVVIDGAKGWARDVDRGMTKEAPAEAPAMVAAILYALRMPQLLPSLLDKEFKLAPLGEVQVEGRPAAGVTVAHQDRKDVRLYFDKESGLPVKSEIRLTEPSGKEVDFEFLYSNYKELAGVKHPTRIHVKGADKVNVIVELTSVTAQEKLDAGLFAAPE